MLSGVFECGGAGRKLQHSEALDKLRVVLLQFHVGRSQELDFNPHGHLAVAEVHRRHQLKVLVTHVVAAGVEQELQKFGIPTVAELDGVERQINVDTSDVLGICGWKKEIWYPATDDHHCVTEGGQDLTDIDEDTASGFDLAVGVVTLMQRFGTHFVAADHAGLSRC
jgi:hypothetical protein